MKLNAISLTSLVVVLTMLEDVSADYVVQDRFFSSSGRYSDSGELLSTYHAEEEAEGPPYKLFDDQIYITGNSLGYISTYLVDLADWCPADGTGICPEPLPATRVWGNAPNLPPFEAVPAGGGAVKYFHLSFPGSIVDFPGGDKYTFAGVTPTTADELQGPPSSTDPVLPIKLSFDNPKLITPVGFNAPNQPQLPEGIGSPIAAPDGSVLFSSWSRIDNVTFEYSVQRLVISEPNPAEPFGSYSLETLFPSDYFIRDLEFGPNGMLYATGGDGMEARVLVYNYSNGGNVEELIDLSAHASSDDRSFGGTFFDVQGNLLVSETGPVSLNPLSSPTSQSRLLEFDGTTGEFRRVALTTQGSYAYFGDGFYLSVPEPSSAGLMALLVALLGGPARRATRPRN